MPGNPKSRMVQGPRPETCSRMKSVHRCTNSVWHPGRSWRSRALLQQSSRPLACAMAACRRDAWPGSLEAIPLLYGEEAHQGMLPGPRRRAQIVPRLMSNTVQVSSGRKPLPQHPALAAHASHRHAQRRKHASGEKMVAEPSSRIQWAEQETRL